MQEQGAFWQCVRGVKRPGVARNRGVTRINARGQSTTLEKREHSIEYLLCTSGSRLLAPSAEDNESL